MARGMGPDGRPRPAAPERAGHGTGTRRWLGPAIWRAAEYRRQSYFFLRHDLTDPRVQDAYRGQRDLFRRSCRFLSVGAEPIAIPFEPVPLPGYVFRPSGADDRARPRY